MKRGVFDVFHHVSPHHLHRYVTEVQFRCNEQQESGGTRTLNAIVMGEWKRLMFREPIAKPE